MLSRDGTGQAGDAAPSDSEHAMSRSAAEHTAALATDLIVRFPQAMRAVLELLAVIPPAQWPIELEALQRSAQAVERVRLAQALLDRVCGPAPAVASAVRAQVTDERPDGGVHAIYQIGGPTGSELSVALDHRSAELVIAQHPAGLSAKGSGWQGVLRDLRALLQDPRVGALLDGSPALAARNDDA